MAVETWVQFPGLTFYFLLLPFPAVISICADRMYEGIYLQHHSVFMQRESTMGVLRGHWLCNDLRANS